MASRAKKKTYGNTIYRELTRVSGQIHIYLTYMPLTRRNFLYISTYMPRVRGYIQQYSPQLRAYICKYMWKMPRTQGIYVKYI